MDIAQRKQKILAAVIENYINNGEPVGSKMLEKNEGFNVSSATIRNELADLTALGLLKQPHTSAGRVPTQMGYRYYVNNLMGSEPLSDRVKSYILNRLQKVSDAPEHILQGASDLLCEITGTTAIATTPAGEDIRVRKIKFVQTGRYTAMMVLVTSSGMVKSRLFRCDFDITSEMLDLFDRALNERLAGEPLFNINQPFIQTFAASFGELSLLMADMLMAVMDACKEACSVNVYLSGATKLLHHGDNDLFSSLTLLEYLSNNSNNEKLLSNVPDGTNIYIGRENPQAELRNNSLIATKYTIGNQSAGTIALITPLRFDYRKAVSVVENTAQAVGYLIEDVITTEK
ncbi:MAG: heat-inducible transcriptional repressor HrcA [Ruminococcus sp.]